MNCCDENKVIRSEEDKKNLINRISRISGQVDGVKKMIENDRYCPDILIQLASIEKSIKSLSSIILDNHMHSCVIKGIKEGDESKIDEVIDLFRRF
ncbi:MAG: metal-sensing transcriptional repressor [Bacilli bacterium]|nr:metal-sensing transcriptional repressor [Bacilli bacterium]